MRLAFETCDVFTACRFGGNPLAVVYGADSLDPAEMPRITREFNLSETVFVLRPDTPDGDARLRIFTPGRELAFAGHPNVGTAVLLARRFGTRRETLALDQPAGRVTARLHRDAAGEITGAEIEAPQPYRAEATLDPAVVARCVGLAVDAIATERHAPLRAGCGNRFHLAELRDLELLASARPDAAALGTEMPAGGLLLHVALPDGGRRVRMFGPHIGVAEDPATGSAAVTLAGLLLDTSDTAALSIALEQGIEMGRPSRLAIRAWRDDAGAIRTAVGGGVVAVTSGWMDVG